MRRAAGLVLCLLAGAAAGQPSCPDAAAVGQEHLLGLWRAEFAGQWQGATLLLEPHAQYALSVSGAINRNGRRGLLAGDIEEGALTLEESDDGQRIAAVFLGEVVQGSCGREIRGTWKRDGEAAGQPFVLRKQ